MTQSFCCLVSIPFAELPAVVTTLKEMIEKITVPISTPPSTWSTPTPSVDRPVSAHSSPQVLTDPDDMVNTSKCINSVVFTHVGIHVGLAIQCSSRPFHCTHKLERKHVQLYWMYIIHDRLGNAMMTSPNFSCYRGSL